MCCSVVLVHGSMPCQVQYWQTTSHIEAPVPLLENCKILVADDVGTASFGESGLHCWNSLPTEQVGALCTDMPSSVSAPVRLLPLGKRSLLPWPHVYQVTLRCGLLMHTTSLLVLPVTGCLERSQKLHKGSFQQINTIWSRVCKAVVLTHARHIWVKPWENVSTVQSAPIDSQNMVPITISPCCGHSPLLPSCLVSRGTLSLFPCSLMLIRSIASAHFEGPSAILCLHLHPCCLAVAQAMPGALTSLPSQLASSLPH